MLPESCMDCGFKDVQRDPDPHDSFCSDDLKVMCGSVKKAATWACRPYNIRKETTPPPEWCPLRKTLGDQPDRKAKKMCTKTEPDQTLYQAILALVMDRAPEDATKAEILSAVRMMEQEFDKIFC